MTLRYMLDTSLCIDVLRRRPPDVSVRFNASAGAMALSTVATMELLYGAERSVDPVRTRAALADFMDRLIVLPFDADAADHAARIRADLGRKGHSIGLYDCLIAGHARSRGLVVVTGNIREFERVDGLMIENWL